MSDVRSGGCLAVLTSDWHLTLKPPLARSCEKDWLGVQAGYIEQVSTLCTQYQAPLIHAGDLFDKPDPPSELLVWLMRRLPYPCYAVPGQHDLYGHRFDSWPRTGFGVMVQAGRITLLEPGEPLGLANLVLYGFPWGCEVTPCRKKKHLLEDRVKLAVVHAYIWTKGWRYPDAPREQRYAAYAPKLEGYDAAVFGDNHQGFLLPRSDSGKYCPLLNCGTFLCRKQDERDHRPAVGLLLKDGNIRRYYLDTSEDRFIDFEGEVAKEHLDATEFLEELAALGDQALDFAETLRRAAGDNKVSGSVRALIIKMLEEKT